MRRVSSSSQGRLSTCSQPVQLNTHTHTHSCLQQYTEQCADIERSTHNDAHMWGRVKVFTRRLRYFFVQIMSIFTLSANKLPKCDPFLFFAADFSEPSHREQMHQPSRFGFFCGTDATSVSHSNNSIHSWLTQSIGDQLGLFGSSGPSSHLLKCLPHPKISPELAAVQVSALLRGGNTLPFSITTTV